MSARLLWLSIGLALTALASPAGAQKPRFKDLPRNHPTQCPYCLGEPERMQASGIVSHGGFAFSKTDTDGVDSLLATSDIRWVETAHVDIGFALGPKKVSQKEKDKIRAELTELAELLPEAEINPKARILDPWLRSHIYARRVEALYAEMQGLLGVTDADFPDGTAPWNMQGNYMGEGPYLGQKGKYELLIVPSQVVHENFLRDQFGLRLRRTQRYNVIDTDSLIVCMHTETEGLRVDEALHGHLAFNLSHNLLDGYKHYSYDLPIWMREGIAHWLERRINPRFNTFDGSEGAAGEKTRKADWRAPTRKLVQQGKAPRMAQLLALRGFGELTLDHHFTTWSMIDFLVQEHPGFLAALVGRIKGLVNAEGISDGTGLPEVHREVFQSELGLSYAGFDQAWREWVLAVY